jgi:phage-related protein
MPRCEIEYYETSRGRCPVAKHLDNLDHKEFATVQKKINQLEEHGMDMLKWGHDHLDHHEDGIYVLRTHYRRNRHRVFLFFVHKGKAVLTNATVKKVGPIAHSHIKKAKEYRQDYLSQHQEEAR